MPGVADLEVEKTAPLLEPVTKEIKEVKKCEAVEDTAEATKKELPAADKEAASEPTPPKGADDKTNDDVDVTAAERTESVTEETNGAAKTVEEPVEKKVDEPSSDKVAAPADPLKDDSGAKSTETKTSEVTETEETKPNNPPKVEQTDADSTKMAVNEANDAKESPKPAPQEEEKLDASKDAPESKAAKSEEQAVSSTVSPSTREIEAQISEMRKKGLAHFILKDFFAAADCFGKVLELQAPLYGEVSEKLAETYFLYGSSMLEYGKSETTVLGENIKGEEEEAAESEDDEEDEEKMEVEATEVADSEVSSKKEESGTSSEPKDSSPVDESTTEDKDDDDSFRVAWEMLELAKTTFKKGDNKKRLADTLMKLGEVGIETGNAEAVTEMIEGLNVRKEAFPEGHRIVPESHFTIGVAYAYFEKYDEAVHHFTEAKACLEKRIESLSKSEVKEDKEEVEEMKGLLPDIQLKIQDTLESKADKAKIAEKQAMEEQAKTPFPASSSSDAKPVSNISHLIKRKRNVDDIAAERVAKQSRKDGADAGQPDSEQSTEEVAAKPGQAEKTVDTVEAKDVPQEVSKPDKEEPVKVDDAEVSTSTIEAPKLDEAQKDAPKADDPQQDAPKDPKDSSSTPATSEDPVSSTENETAPTEADKEEKMDVN